MVLGSAVKYIVLPAGSKRNEHSPGSRSPGCYGQIKGLAPEAIYWESRLFAIFSSDNGVRT